MPAVAPSMSRVSSLIIDCTTTGWSLPIHTSPTRTLRVLRRRRVVA
jgi:hypothetical protein